MLECVAVEIMLLSVELLSTLLYGFHSPPAPHFLHICALFSSSEILLGKYRGLFVLLICCNLQGFGGGQFSISELSVLQLMLELE